MRLLGAQDYRVMPWKNGRGTTTELFVAGESGSGFDWRVSIATVSSNGPFSRFEGYDRHIMCIEGEGFMLDGGPEGEIEVSPDFRPMQFSGDWPIFGRLRDGPARDFNLIVRRELFESSLECGNGNQIAMPRDQCMWQFVYVLDGELSYNGSTMVAAASLLFEPGEDVHISCSGRVVRACVWYRPNDHRFE